MSSFGEEGQVEKCKKAEDPLGYVMVQLEAAAVGWETGEVAAWMIVGLRWHLDFASFVESDSAVEQYVGYHSGGHEGYRSWRRWTWSRCPCPWPRCPASWESLWRRWLRDFDRSTIAIGPQKCLQSSPKKENIGSIIFWPSKWLHTNSSTILVQGCAMGLLMQVDDFTFVMFISFFSKLHHI